jgi:hypothetical protein
MAYSFGNLFSRQNLNLLVGLITLFLILWLIMYAVPGLFVSMFDTNLGNLILIAFIFLASMYSINLALGLSVVFLILWRFSHMSIEKFII